MTLILRGRTRGVSVAYPETVDPSPPPTRSKARPTVVAFDVSRAQRRDGHETSTRVEAARRLAELTGFDFGGEHDPRIPHGGRTYFVPSDTLTSDLAANLGIVTADDLFGGVVPAAFMATKTITHPLIEPNAFTPQGWSAEFPRLVANSVLAGYSAFTKEDALRAGAMLLERGPARVKLASGIAGVGQWLAENIASLTEILDGLSERDFADSGVVIEENVINVVTNSVGYVRVSGLTAAYCGTQHTTINNHGAEVYGGSELRVVRGGFSSLLALDLPKDVRLAIAQARVYDDAADRCFPGFFASRRNYDVAQGDDAQGHRRSGVLEQSWRLGGATGAEIAALELFRADERLQTVRAVTREVYGDAEEPPANAAVYFRGVDPRVGAMTKFALAEPYADAR